MTAETTEKRDRKKIVPIVLASIAVVGVGAALTSAAWTDDVSFSATATASSFDLQGRVVGDATWHDDNVTKGPGGDVTIVIPAAELSGLSPDSEVSVDFELRNAGTVDGEITAVAVSTGGTGIFGGAAPATAEVDTTLSGASAEPLLIGTGSTIHGTLTVSAPATWDSSYFTKTGTVTVTISSTSL